MTRFLLRTLAAGIVLVIPALSLSLALAPAAENPVLTLEQGDHVCVIGNTLAERMQHHGWLETLLHSRFPKHELVVRNLGFSGDELTMRLRSAGFGSQDEHLAINKADVIFACFGYNESFAGPAGLEKFKADLDAIVKHTLGQQYNGQSAPRLVLFSPIAHEDLGDRNLPNGSQTNPNLQLYGEAMAAVAQANGVPFVDLFSPSQKLYAQSDKPLTINGVHPNEQGDMALATAIDQALFPGPLTPTRATESLAKLRAAVLDKNFYWYQRHRTVDGYSIYGGRADLKFVEGQTNREVTQRELEVLDAMTANRDHRIWAIAQGQDLSVDDANTPEFIPVQTNKPGAGPNGEHIFPSGLSAIEKLTIGPDLQMNLVASEESFPELANPVQMSFDTRGRLWVAAWPTYPHWKPKEEMNDKLVILLDDDGDGHADRCHTFADGLHCPTGFEFWNGGVLVAQAPDLMFLKDTDGDDVADVRQRVLHGIDSADTHHTANSFTFDPGGALYFQEGTFHHTQVETPWGPPVRCANAGVFRYEPLAQKFEVYVSYGFANPHGHVFDRWGQDIVVDGTGSNPFHGTLFSGHVDFPHKHGAPPQVYQQRTRPCPAIEYCSSRHFPEDFQGNLLVGDVINFNGVLRYRIEDRQSSFFGTELSPVLQSSEAIFRPSDLEIAPDGSLYLCDWCNPIIGHMQHNLRDPSRDRSHGRVYRVTCADRPLLDPPAIAGEPIEALLELLKSPEDRVRYRTKIELSARDSEQVIAAVQRWATGLDPSDPEHEHHQMEALWVHQWHNAVNPELLDRMLASPRFEARAAAVRVLCTWRDRLDDPLARLQKAVNDEHPRVRLEAIRALSFYHGPQAVRAQEIVAEALLHPDDDYIRYLFKETGDALARQAQTP